MMTIEIAPAILVLQDELAPYEVKHVRYALDVAMRITSFRIAEGKELNVHAIILANVSVLMAGPIEASAFMTEQECVLDVPSMGAGNQVCIIVSNPTDSHVQFKAILSGKQAISNL